MSAQGMLLTVLATQIAEAVAKDETPEVGGCDISAGTFGPHFSQLLRELVGQLAERAALLSALRIARVYVEDAYFCDFPDDAENAAVLAAIDATIAKAEGGAA